MAKQLRSPARPLIQKPSALYLQALRLFWRGESEGALALVADALAEGSSDQPEVFYRLWIEVLAQDHDDASLRILQEHLSRGLDYKSPTWVNQYALIGLIHYELGEVEAAHLILKAAKKHQNNAYYRELQCVLEPEADAERLAVLSRGLIRQTRDYLHYRRAALMSHMASKKALMRAIFLRMQESFGQDPLADEIGFHEAFAQGSYRSAWEHARQLRENFPLHINFQFFYAYASYKTERNELALQEFLQLNRRLDGSDPDVLCMICTALLASRSREGLNKAEDVAIRQYLKRAVQRLAAMGLSAAYPLDLLQRFEKAEIAQPGRIWMVQLTARQCVELYERPLEKIEILHRAMGEHVAKNDLCFFVTNNPTATDENSWRLVALYKAVSQPQWHPLHRWYTSLKLQSRMEVGIPFTLEKRSLKNTAAKRFGLFEVDSKVLEILEESVKAFTLEDQNYSRIVAELKSVGSL